ncbi:Pex12 amino terminal region-domain-containing protein [Triangularia verruculosa]|uniref:Pex12 amino terminal region-domain-containing protein n=1 Tax=Triangularia verruculosa TaxID=2587418 RepID=A0AAN7AZ12_9PEZI|nr:Pex12 amino terminal region-domain-containing protein [Triangularia verruculosa]
MSDPKPPKDSSSPSAAAPDAVAPAAAPAPAPASVAVTPPSNPPSANSFAQAQQRLIARRQARDAQEAARVAAQQSESQLRTRIAASQSPLLRRVGASTLSIWDAISSREGTRPAFRVGQVDAELLDEELVELMKGQVGEAVRYYGGGGGGNNTIKHDWDAEISLALRAVIFKLTIWDHDATYGAALQNLKYTDARHTGSVLVPPSKWQKGMYGLFTVGGRYLWSKWENWLMEQDDGFDEPSPTVQRLSSMTDRLSTLHAAASFASFLVFLLQGRYRTLLDRVLRMRLAPPTSQVSREVSFEYLNRQLVWHAFTEFLLFVLPLVGINRWRRWLARTWRKTKKIISTTGGDGAAEKQGDFDFLPERTCAICYQDQNQATNENELMAAATSKTGVVGSAQTDITNPYEAIPCGCVYCFVCLATRIEREEGEGWNCLRCGELVKECKPWSGDVLEQESKSPIQKTVVFADDVKDASDDERGGSQVLVEQEDSDDDYQEQDEDEEEHGDRSLEELRAETPSVESSDQEADSNGDESEDYEAEEEELGADLDDE